MKDTHTADVLLALRRFIGVNRWERAGECQATVWPATDSRLSTGQVVKGLSWIAARGICAARPNR